MAVAKDIKYLLNKSYQGAPKPKIYNKSQTRLLRGAIYLFRYSNPKYKKILPYYDARPLVLIFRSTSKYIIGINLHFIPWTWRVNYTKKIIKKIKNKKRLKYSEIKKAADSVKMPEIFAYFSIRKYIRGRIGSKLYQFNHENWKTATHNIPPNFKKAQDSEIMRDINRKVRELRIKKKKEGTLK